MFQCFFMILITSGLFGLNFVTKLDNLFQSVYKSGHSTETDLVNIKSDIEASLA
jgi:hypothetical protein